jgi:hypothetical protein
VCIVNARRKRRYRHWAPSVASLLEGRDNPQIFSIYTRPRPGEEADIPHVREYTADELGRTVQAAGFEVETLFTENIPEYDHHRRLLGFLQENGYDIRLRGEQTYWRCRWCGVRAGCIRSDMADTIFVEERLAYASARWPFDVGWKIKCDVHGVLLHHDA